MRFASSLLLGLPLVSSHVAKRPTHQRPLNPAIKTFRETSIYRTPDPIELTKIDPQSEFHVYDHFGEDVVYAGIATFGHLNYTNCFSPENDNTFDIGIVGMPFDLGVSFRPGQRFGPAATRTGSQRISPAMGWR